jgi:hypothetical protein
MLKRWRIGPERPGPASAALDRLATDLRALTAEQVAQIEESAKVETHRRAAIAALREAVWQRKLVDIHEAHSLLEIGFLVPADPLGTATEAAARAAVAVYLRGRLDPLAYGVLVAPLRMITWLEEES